MYIEYFSMYVLFNIGIYLKCIHTKAKTKMRIYLHLLITKYIMFCKKRLSLKTIKSLVYLSSLQLFNLLLKSHNYRVINA